MHGPGREPWEVYTITDDLAGRDVVVEESREHPTGDAQACWPAREARAPGRLSRGSHGADSREHHPSH